jgi:hypothetical protein
MGTLQLSPYEFHQVLSYQADLKKLPHLSAKLGSNCLQIVCIAFAPDSSVRSARVLSRDGAGRWLAASTPRQPELRIRLRDWLHIPLQ